MKRALHHIRFKQDAPQLEAKDCLFYNILSGTKTDEYENKQPEYKGQEANEGHSQ